MDNYTN